MPASSPVAVPPASFVPQLLRPASSGAAKSRVAFVLLGVFLGFFGLHNFYAGYNKKGAIQLALTILTFFYAAAVSWVWAIVEVCVINEDSEGELFA
jgi:TM2 domain-containing membrane protein YozV